MINMFSVIVVVVTSFAN